QVVGYAPDETPTPAIHPGPTRLRAASATVRSSTGVGPRFGSPGTSTVGKRAGGPPSGGLTEDESMTSRACSALVRDLPSRPGRPRPGRSRSSFSPSCLLRRSTSDQREEQRAGPAQDAAGRTSTGGCPKSEATGRPADRTPIGSEER